MNELSEVLSGALNKQKKQQAGSDYTATVTKVDGQTAYVRITGSDIADTPVALSIGCKPGDTVRVRIADGKGWITGNDTSPPTDNTEVEQIVADLSDYVKKRMSGNGGDYSQILQTINEIVLEVGNKMDSDMGNRASTIEISQGLIKFLSNSIVIDSSNFSLDSDGNATFSGQLSAASGSFNGKVIFTHPMNSSTVHIGDTGWNAPICLEGSQSNPYIEYLITSIYPGSIYFSKDDASIYTTVDPDGVHHVSDRRIKENIVEIKPELARKLRPVQFQFKGKDAICYGFIAQEVEKVIPSAVSEGKNGYLQLNYQEFIAPIYALVQDQEKRITQLEERLKALEDKP
jgi:hypothetical protein